MTTIRLEFPASRYHATPWGRHVNEGVTEWPPSPYRLLRALYDVWKRKCPHLTEAQTESVLRALSPEPRYALPSASASHTRSYLRSDKQDPTDKNLVFDGFLAFNRDARCFVSWPGVDLTGEQKEVLRELLRNLNYLGRSESWIAADLYDGKPESDFLCDPVDQAEYAGEVTPVHCAVPPADYKGQGRWLDALTTSTTQVAKQRVSSPPLLRQVRYLRPERCIETDPIPAFRRKSPDIHAVLLGLDSTVLPLVTSTLEVAEQVRVRLMGAHKRLMDGDESAVSPLFSGKAPDGNKRLDHGHVYILPLPDSNCQRIDRILLLSKFQAFTREELDAVRFVRELWQPDGRPIARCVMTWQGGLDHSVIRRQQTTVVSRTPFVTTRHWRRGRDRTQFLEEEVRRECRNHGIEEPALINSLDHIPGSPFELVEFRRNRKQDSVRDGYAFKLHFHNPVPAPFSIGYGAHFGLGQFGVEERCGRLT